MRGWRKAEESVENEGAEKAESKAQRVWQKIVAKLLQYSVLICR